ncbi:MAG: hypothetical protein V1822_01630 [Candidatus Micrarchaeota archaeon]
MDLDLKVAASICIFAVILILGITQLNLFGQAADVNKLAAGGLGENGQQAGANNYQNGAAEDAAAGQGFANAQSADENGSRPNGGFGRMGAGFNGSRGNYSNGSFLNRSFNASSNGNYRRGMNETLFNGTFYGGMNSSGGFMDSDEARAACAGKSSGEECSFDSGRGEINGACRQFDSSIVCVPQFFGNLSGQ